MIVPGHWPSQAPYEEFALPELLRRSAERFGDKPALIGGDGTTHTYRELWSYTRKVARFLQDHGIEKGDKVAIFSPNHVNYAPIFYGALLAGGTVTMLNPLYREREIEHQLDDAEAIALFVFSPMAEPVEAARKNLPVCATFGLSRGCWIWWEACRRSIGRWRSTRGRTWPCCPIPAARRAFPRV